MHLSMASANNGVRTRRADPQGYPIPDRDTVYLISQAFVGNAFVQHSVATTAHANGTFSRRVRIRTRIHTGRYTITARCGGGNLGVSAHLTVH